MTARLRLALFLVLVALVAAGACYVCARWMAQKYSLDSAAHHYAIHKQLKLTLEQHKALAPAEKKFAERKERLEKTIREANEELAQALAADRADSPRVRAAVGKIHQAQGELQQAVLDHIFDMKPVLSAEQYDRLIQLTAEALRAASQPD